MLVASRQLQRPPDAALEAPGVTYLLEKAFLRRQGRGNSFPLPCGICGTFGLLQITHGSHRRKCVRCACVSKIDVSPTREGWQIRSVPASAA